MKPADVIAAVCEFYRLDRVELCGDSRARHISGPRHTLVWALRQKTDLAWRDIGLLCGGRDVRTMLGSFDIVSARKGQDEDYAARLAALMAHIDGWRPLDVNVAPTLVRARRLISTGEQSANEDALACGISLLTVASILQASALTADEARRAALRVLCGDTAEPAQTLTTINPISPGGRHVQ